MQVIHALPRRRVGIEHEPEAVVREAELAHTTDPAERVAGAIADPPPVSAAPPEQAAELHSEEERAKLDRLVEEKTRAP